MFIQFIFMTDLYFLYFVILMLNSDDDEDLCWIWLRASIVWN